MRHTKPLTALREIIRELIAEGIDDDGDVAAELERRCVAPAGWSKCKVEVMRRFSTMIADPDQAVRARAAQFRQRASRRR